MGRCIGLDVHRDFAQVAIWENGRVKDAGRVATSPERLREFAATLRQTDRVALEATMNTAAIAGLLAERAGEVVVSNPFKTRVIAEAKIKTDKVDARVLAELLAADYLPSVWQADDRYFHLEAADRDLVAVRRGEHNRRPDRHRPVSRTFLPDPNDVPWAVAAYLAAQLGIADPGVLKRYAACEGTNRLHAGEIEHVYGYRDFTHPAVHGLMPIKNWLVPLKFSGYALLRALRIRPTTTPRRPKV